MNQKLFEIKNIGESNTIKKIKLRILTKIRVIRILFINDPP